jgi:hypothetical protein
MTAAPAVAGLAAYFLSLDPSELGGVNLHQKGKVAKNVKDFIIAKAYERANKGKKVIWNLLEGDLKP